MHFHILYLKIRNETFFTFLWQITRRGRPQNNLYGKKYYNLPNLLYLCHQSYAMYCGGQPQPYTHDSPETPYSVNLYIIYFILHSIFLIFASEAYT